VSLQIELSVAHDGSMAKRYYSKKMFAERVGMQMGELSSYEKLVSFPKPDVIVGEGPRATRGWSEETIDRWNSARRGSGNRIAVPSKQSRSAKK